MSIGFIYGPAGSGKSRQVYLRVLKEAGENPNKRYIFIVPEQFALGTERELVSLSRGHGIINIEVLSFTRLAYRIMEAAGDRMLPILNDIGKTMLLKNIIRRESGSLLLYKGKERSIGFLDEIKSLISEFSQYMITPEMLNTALSSCNRESVLYYKLSDLYTIYSSFIKDIESKGYATQETMAELCFGHIGSCGLLKGAELIFDGFTGFTPIQYEFIERIMFLGGDLSFCITGDKSLIKEGSWEKGGIPEFSDDPALFDMSREMGEKLCQMGIRCGHTIREPEFVCYAASDTSLTHLKNNIFREKKTKIDGGSLVIINSMHSKREECDYIAAKISELIRSEDLKYGEIAVISGDQAGYAPYLKESLEAFSLPFHIDENQSIAGNPLIHFIVQALEVPASAFKADSVIALVKSPLFAAEELSVCEFENYLISKGYRGEKSYRREWKAGYRGRQELSLEAVNSVRERVMRLLEPVMGLKKQNSGEELICAIKELLIRAGASDTLLSIAENMTEGDHRDAKRLKREYERVYEAVLLLLDQIGAIMQGEELSVREFKDLFFAGAQKTALGMIPRKNDVIIVGDIKRTRLSGIKVLFMPGMNEGVVPAGNISSGLLNKDDRDMLLSWGSELAKQPEDMPEREEYYVYLALSKPEKRLFLSFCRNEEGGSESEGERKPSYVISQVMDCFYDVAVSFDGADCMARLLGRDGGLFEIAKNNEFNNSRTSNKELLFALKEYYRQTGDQKADILSEISDYSARAISENLSEELASRIYGKVIKSSVTRIETFDECAFRHFADYGLGLTDRPVSSPKPFDYGNVFHDALMIYMKRLSQEGYDWSRGNCPENKGKAKDALYESVSAYEEAMYFSDKRLVAMVGRMERIMLVVTDAIHSQLASGSYKPMAFEKSFNISDRNMLLTGKIDRIDIAAENGQDYIKVVDYKTSGTPHKADLTKLWYGLNIQLPLYLNELVKNVYKGSVPSLAFYQQVDMPDVAYSEKTNSEDGAQQTRVKALAPKGLIKIGIEDIKRLDTGAVDEDGGLRPSYDSDVNDFKITKEGKLSFLTGNVSLKDDELLTLCGFAEEKVRESAKEIMSGRTDINPYVYNAEDACTFCSLKSVCGYDEKQKRYRDGRRKLIEKELSDFTGDE